MSKKSPYKRMMLEGKYFSMPRTSGLFLGSSFQKPKINELAWSSTEARDQVESDMKRITKILGKASQQTVKIMMDGVKGGRYDAMDLSKSIETGPSKLVHAGEKEFMRVLWTKVRDGFRRYSKRGKLR